MVEAFLLLLERYECWSYMGVNTHWGRRSAFATGVAAPAKAGEPSA
jgi:hypothetical protein